MLVDGAGYKRSRSEDNILQVNDEEFEDEAFAEGTAENVTCTPVLIGEAMSRDDPFYQPSISNPFADMAGFNKGCKLLGKSFGDVDSVMFELPSPSSPTTPPCTPNQSGGGNSARRLSTRQKSQSLPCSPVLLRKAAERLHQESIHGSNSKKNSLNPNRFSFSAYSTRSKSVFFPEAVAQRLQYEMFDTGSPYNGRSREGSVESDSQSNGNGVNYSMVRNSRRFSNLETRINRRGETLSLCNSYTNSRQVSIDESGDNENSYSVYPSLTYAKDGSKSNQTCLNNNNNSTNFYLSSPPESNMKREKSAGSISSVSDSEDFDPWSMRKEMLTDTAIIEEGSCPVGVMETSV